MDPEGSVASRPVTSLPARVFAWIVAGPPAYLIVPGWILAALAAVMYLPPLGTGQASIGDFVSSDLPAVKAEAAAARHFSNPGLSRVAVVQRDAAGLPLAVQQRTLAAAARLDTGRSSGSEIRAALPVIDVPGLAGGGLIAGSAALGSPTRATTAITYLFFDPALSWDAQAAAAGRYAASLGGPAASVVGVTGTIPARLVQGQAISDRLPLVELATVVLIALIVGLTFRSVGAPLVTLSAGVIAYLVAVRVVAWVGEHTGITVPGELEPLMVVLLFGIVTDYSIFFLSGMRRRLGEGLRRGPAARRTTAHFAPTILTAGLMVAAGTAVLVVAAQRFFRVFGPGLALAVLVGLVVAITLVPALLAVFGRLLYWPRVPHVRRRSSATARFVDETAARRGEAAAGAAVSPRRPSILTSRPAAAVIALVCVCVLVAAATGIRHASLGLGLITSLPAHDRVKEAAHAAEAGFSRGTLSPTEVIVRRTDVARLTPSLARLERLVGAQPGVAGVVGPREQQLLDAQGVGGLALAPTGAAARYLVVFKGDPLGSSGIGQYDHLRAVMPSLLRQAGLAGSAVTYAGDTAIAQQTVHQTTTDLARIAIAVVVVDLLLLVVFLRALIAPLYLLAASVLAVAASIGVTAFLFTVVLHEDLVYYVPFTAAVLLIALGSDYNVFLVGRIWDEARQRPLRPAIETAVPQARSTISVAALALALSFAMLAVVDLSAFRQLAFLLFAGVLIDAFFVRSLLVPALVALFGGASAWPGVLRRRRREPGGAGIGLPESTPTVEGDTPEERRAA